MELIDRFMIELSLANPSFRPLLQPALIGHPETLLLVEFIGDDAASLQAKLDDLVALMGDLGLPGSVVALSDAGAQKNIWEVRKFRGAYSGEDVTIPRR